MKGRRSCSSWKKESKASLLLLLRRRKRKARSKNTTTERIRVVSEEKKREEEVEVVVVLGVLGSDEWKKLRVPMPLLLLLVPRSPIARFQLLESLR